jgi:hypothetical protein
MEKFHVVVKSYSNKEYRDVITSSPESERIAERIERGVNINLNHDEYYTELEEVTE